MAISLKIRSSQIEDFLPDRWYNILPDLPEPLPMPLRTDGKPVTPSDMEPLFPKTLLQQEFSSERFIGIPEELREAFLEIGRPTPLLRARKLEEKLRTPARIFYKYEGVLPAGSHKINTAMAQAYFNMKEGTERLTTETGAGQWGSALSQACSLFGLKLKVFMVRVSYNQKPYRKTVMRLFGAEVVPSPSTHTEVGRKILKENPDHPGSLGIAISEAIEEAVKDPKTKYSLGSVLNHVLLHQTIIGEEAILQLQELDVEPDYVVGAVGGGSNYAGLAYPFVRLMLEKRLEAKFIAVEPKAVPSMTQGEYRYDHGDTGKMTPLIKMHTLGHDFIPPPIHAGGLRYHGVAPTLSILIKNGIVQPKAYPQTSVFEAARIFAQSEGIIPAPESAHAVKEAIELALEAKRKNQTINILFNLSGHGLLDLKGYEDFLDGKLSD